jgi:hypothetical protein
MNYTPDAPGIYHGKQVIINSDRLLFNAKEDSILLYSDKAIGFSTNGNIHFDTNENKEGENSNNFIINSPNIYLGLDEGNLPTEPALLGNITEEWLNNMLDMIDGVLDDLTMKISFITTIPGSPTAPNPGNEGMLATRRIQIQQLKADIKELKSKNTKLV